MEKQINSSDKRPMQNCKGGVRDLSATFQSMRKKAQTKPTKKSEQDFLRERFKPLNKKFGKQNNKKEKIDDEDDEETNRR